MKERTRNSRLNKQSGQSSEKKGRMMLRLVSVLIGLVIWLTVVNISNPEVTRTRTVPVTVVNTEVLTAAGKCYTIQGGDTVTVSYQVRSRDAYRIEADTFRAVADLANLYSVTGSVPVTVEVLKNKELLIGTPAVRPQVIHVSTEDLQNKSFSVSSSVRGQVLPNHSVGTITVSPETIMVSGPISQVGRISSVGIMVDVSGHGDDFSGTERPRFFDANGNVISFGEEGPVTEPEEIAYEVDMLLGKTLTLRFEVSGNAAPGYRFTGAESAMKSVAVVGEDVILEKLNEVVIPGTALNVEGATENRAVTVDLSQFPGQRDRDDRAERGTGLYSVSQSDICRVERSSGGTGFHYLRGPERGTGCFRDGCRQLYGAPFCYSSPRHQHCFDHAFHGDRIPGTGRTLWHLCRGKRTGERAGSGIYGNGTGSLRRDGEQCVRQ